MLHLFGQNFQNEKGSKEAPLRIKADFNEMQLVEKYIDVYSQTANY